MIQDFYDSLGNKYSIQSNIGRCILSSFCELEFQCLTWLMYEQSQFAPITLTIYLSLRAVLSAEGGPTEVLRVEAARDARRRGTPAYKDGTVPFRPDHLIDVP